MSVFKFKKPMLISDYKRQREIAKMNIAQITRSLKKSQRKRRKWVNQFIVLWDDGLWRWRKVVFCLILLSIINCVIKFNGFFEFKFEHFENTYPNIMFGWNFILGANRVVLFCMKYLRTKSRFMFFNTKRTAVKLVEIDRKAKSNQQCNLESHKQRLGVFGRTLMAISMPKRKRNNRN